VRRKTERNIYIYIKKKKPRDRRESRGKRRRKNDRDRDKEGGNQQNTGELTGERRNKETETEGD
jgi:hypothetical protein